MAEVSVSELVPLDPEEGWRLLSDLSRLDEWLTLHEAWRSEIPGELATGVELESIVAFKGMRNRVRWRIDEFRPPHLITLNGDGKGGTTASLRFSAEAEGDGTRVELHSEFSNPALIGPLGGIAARSLKGELRKSIERLAALGS
jgi:carbon monoxide dehydrogenase subunit G